MPIRLSVPPIVALLAMTMKIIAHIMFQVAEHVKHSF